MRLDLIMAPRFLQTQTVRLNTELAEAWWAERHMLYTWTTRSTVTAVTFAPPGLVSALTHQQKLRWVKRTCGDVSGTTHCAWQPRAQHDGMLVSQHGSHQLLHSDSTTA
jgi:hypothetical protein